MSPDSSAAGYSGTPQLRKLGIVPGKSLIVLARPPAWVFAEPVPSGVQLVEAVGGADIVLAFVREPSELDAFEEWGRGVFPAGAVWVAWPRKAAGHASDVTENLIREALHPYGDVIIWAEN